MYSRRNEASAKVSFSHQSPIRCFFNLVSELETITDDMGIEVADLATAKSEAVKAIQELRLENEGEDHWLGWRLEVVSSTGWHLYSVNLHDPDHE